MSELRRIAAVAVCLAAAVSCGGGEVDGARPHTTSTATAHGSDGLESTHEGFHGVLESASIMGQPDRIIAGPQGNEGQFIVECDLSHVASDDPIIYPDQPGASHIHAFFGNVETSAASRVQDLLGAETTCDDSRDTASYWVPVLMDAAAVIEPAYAVAYYRAGIDVDPTTVQAYPPGLVMIAGDPLAQQPQPIETVSWGCGQGARRSVEPPACPDGTDLRMSVTFPDCWDGKNLDSPGHRLHVHYSSSGQCPSTHPVAIPQLVFAVHFVVDGDPSRLRLSSGTLGTGHADFLNSWNQDHLEREVDLCIRQQNVCSISSGRRPA